MKRLLAIISICFLLFIIYYDITKGTLPQSVPVNMNQPSIPVNQTTKTNGLDYFQATIKPGDTLISIIEREAGTLNQPIETIISDFQKLNDGLKPEQMQIGKTYKIPKYPKKP